MAVWLRGLGIHRAVATPAPELGVPGAGATELAEVGRPPGWWLAEPPGLAGVPGPGRDLDDPDRGVSAGRDHPRQLLQPTLSTTFVGLGNYKTIFSTDDILVSFRNNVIWVVVFPFLVTFLGLIFAVLTERIRWADRLQDHHLHADRLQCHRFGAGLEQHHGHRPSRRDGQRGDASRSTTGSVPPGCTRSTPAPGRPSPSGGVRAPGRVAAGTLESTAAVSPGQTSSARHDRHQPGAVAAGRRQAGGRRGRRPRGR